MSTLDTSPQNEFISQFLKGKKGFILVASNQRKSNQIKEKLKGKPEKPGGNFQAGTKEKRKERKDKTLQFHPDKSQDRIDWKSNQPLGALGLEILEGDCFSTSILQGLGELHFTLIFIEIFKIRDSERCLYQNQNQVKNGH